MTEIKRMTPKEFREQGFLRELNRQFLHPLGLALEIIAPDAEEIAAGNDYPERFGGVWDYREDPEGMAFDESMVNTDQAREQAAAIEALRRSKLAVRRERLGFEIQPITPKE